MAKFIENGQFDMHIRKVRRIYLKKRNFLIKCLNDYFHESVSISGANTGMHLIASFTGINFDKKLMEKIEINAVTRHYIISNSDTHTPYDNALIFGYGNTDFSQIEEGIKRLHRVLRDY
jgi:GntR family transcriptional regulator / MocR family aminotransferase